MFTQTTAITDPEIKDFRVMFRGDRRAVDIIKMARGGTLSLTVTKAKRRCSAKQATMFLWTLEAHVENPARLEQTNRLSHG